MKNDKPEIIKSLLPIFQQFKKQSNAFQKKYQKTKDPDVIRKFLKENHFAIHERWVRDVLASWILLEPEKVERIFRRRAGEKNKDIEKRNKALLMATHVDEASQTTTKENAFFDVAEMLGDEDYEHLAAMKKSYPKAKKIMYKVHIEETSDSWIAAVGPALVQYDGHNMVGIWRYELPKKTE